MAAGVATVPIMLESWLRDLRHAARGLAAKPTYTAIVVATLALVIGAASAVLSVVNATMVRPLPFPHSDRLVQLFLMPPGPPAWTNRNPLSTGTFFRFRERLQQAEAVEGLWSRERALGGDVEPETVTAGAVSPGLFGLLGGCPGAGPHVHRGRRPRRTPRSSCWGTRSGSGASAATLPSSGKRC